MPAKQLPGRRKFVRDLAVGLTAVPISGIAQTVSGSGSKPKTPVHGGHGYVFDILDFGAVADRKTLSTKSIQAALDKCPEKRGGKLSITPASFLTPPFFLRS